MTFQSGNLTPVPIDANSKGVVGTYRAMVSGAQTVATAGMPVQLISTPTEAKRLDVTANYNNSDIVTVGGSGVIGAQTGRKGVPIASGNTYTFTITDVSLVWIDSVASGDGVTFNYFY